MSRISHTIWRRQGRASARRLLESNQEKIMRRVLLTLTSVLSLCSLAAPVLAESTGINTVVVTATRTKQLKEKTGSSISVITDEDLKAHQIVAVSDALKETPGLTVVRNGGLGQPASIGLRGATDGQSLFLVDGVRINDPSSTNNQAILGDLFVNNIDRIEVLRGAQSTLYGSDAIGGVVNIITRLGGDNPFALRASAEAGSFDTYHVNASAFGTLDSVEYGAGFNFLHTNGTPAADKRNGNPETDGYRNLGATENLRWNLSDTLSLDLRGYYTDTRADFDDNFSFLPPFLVADSKAYNTDRLASGYAGVNLALFGGKFQNRLAVTASKSSRAFFDSAFDFIHKNSDAKGNSWRLEYQGIVDISKDDQLSFGAETQRISFSDDSFSSFFGNSHDHGHNRVSSVYAQYQTTLFDQLTLTGGVRYDDDDEFGGHTSLKIAGAWALSDGTTVLRANYGDGFKAPSLFQLFSQYSNPITSLQPEKARGWEAGIDQSLLAERVHASLTYFERRSSNQIDFFSCFGTIPPQFVQACIDRAAQGGFYYNVGRTRSRGLEAEVTAAVSDTLQLTANVTDMRAIDLNTHTNLARRPHMMANASATWSPNERLSLGIAANYTGRRFDSTGNFTPMPAYTVVNVYGSYKITDQLEAYGRIENALDKTYEPVDGYGGPERGFFVGLRAAY
jgi:vitamin B12 transporter